VRIKLYPRGTAEGVVTVSKRTQERMPDGSYLPALAVDVDGHVYGMPPPKGVLRLATRLARRVVARFLGAGYRGRYKQKLKPPGTLRRKLHQQGRLTGPDEYAEAVYNILRERGLDPRSADRFGMVEGYRRSGLTVDEAAERLMAEK